MDMILGVVADAANRSEGDKLNILGIFHTIFSPEFPVTHPSMALALEFRAAPYEKGKALELDITMRGPDAQVVVSIQGQIEISRDVPALSPIVPMDISLNNCVFPVPGNYRFEISIDGTRKGEVPLELIHISEPA
jgi:hypothetical protein